MNKILNLKNTIEYENSILDSYNNIILEFDHNDINYINQNNIDSKELNSIIKGYLTNTKEMNQSKIEYNKKNIKKLNNLLFKICKHQWIIDSIDIDPDKSKTIKYCSLCHLTYD